MAGKARLPAFWESAVRSLRNLCGFAARLEAALLAGTVSGRAVRSSVATIAIGAGLLKRSFGATVRVYRRPAPVSVAAPLAQIGASARTVRHVEQRSPDARPYVQNEVPRRSEVGVGVAAALVARRNHPFVSRAALRLFARALKVTPLLPVPARLPLNTVAVVARKVIRAAGADA